jgi:hypothetical protein
MSRSVSNDPIILDGFYMFCERSCDSLFIFV